MFLFFSLDPFFLLFMEVLCIFNICLLCFIDKCFPFFVVVVVVVVGTMPVETNTQRRFNQLKTVVGYSLFKKCAQAVS